MVGIRIEGRRGSPRIGGTTRRITAEQGLTWFQEGLGWRLPGITISSRLPPAPIILGARFLTTVSGEASLKQALGPSGWMMRSLVRSAPSFAEEPGDGEGHALDYWDPPLNNPGRHGHRTQDERQPYPEELAIFTHGVLGVQPFCVKAPDTPHFLRIP